MIKRRNTALWLTIKDDWQPVWDYSASEISRTWEEPNGLPLDGLGEYALGFTLELTSKQSFGNMTSPVAESESTSGPQSISNCRSLATGIVTTDKPYRPHGYKENEKTTSQKCSVSHILSLSHSNFWIFVTSVGCWERFCLKSPAACCTEPIYMVCNLQCMGMTV